MTVSDMAMMGGNRRVATQNEYSEHLGRLPMTMAEMRALSRAACTIVDGRELCIIGCGRLQLTATNPLCKDCNTEKNKRKKEEDEELGARICAGCGDEVASDRKMSKGLCQSCYDKQYRKTGRVVDPATKLCTHVSVCGNKEYMGGLCQRHYRNRHLEASSTSECAAAASTATAPKEKHTSKTRNGKKKTKKKKPVLVEKNAKTEGLAADYEDREEDSDYDNDDEDEWDEGY
jgi:hypothetical protein